MSRSSSLPACAVDADECDATLKSYLDVCAELGCEPAACFMDSLRSGSQCGRIRALDGEEQLYATTTILPYASFTELDLRGLQLPSNDAWCALLAACSRCSNLRAVNVSDCSLGRFGEAEQQEIARTLGACKVAALDASHNQLGDAFVTALSRSALAQHSATLTVLRLAHNGIGDEGTVALAGALQRDGLSCTLKQLDLGHNRVGDAGARSLAAVLAAAPLLALELQGNEVGDAGGVALAAALKVTPSLQRLDLSGNRHGGITLGSMAEALRRNTGSLEELALACSSSSSSCSGAAAAEVAALFRAASSSAQLRSLDVRGVPLADEAIGALAQLLDSRCPLTALRVDVASPEAAEAVARALPRAARRSLTSLQLGGPVPEHVLAFITSTLTGHARCHSSSPSKGAHHTRASPRTSGCSILAGSQAASASLCTPTAVQRSSVSVPCSPGSASERGSSFLQRPHSGSILGGAGTSSSSSSPTRRSLVHTLSGQARRASAIDPQGLVGLSGGGAANKAAEVFKRHDPDDCGYLDAEAMMSALQALGMLEGMGARQLGKFLSDALKEADTDKDGHVTLEDFTRFYERMARVYTEASRKGRIAARNRVPQVPLDAPSNERLKRVHRAYCRLPLGQGRQVGGSSQHLNTAQFNQLCRDGGLLEPAGPLSQCALDIIFTRCKPTGGRRLPFAEFLLAVASLADELGATFDATAHALCSGSAADAAQSADGSPCRGGGGSFVLAAGSGAAGPGRVSSTSSMLAASGSSYGCEPAGVAGSPSFTPTRCGGLTPPAGTTGFGSAPLAAEAVCNPLFDDGDADGGGGASSGAGKGPMLESRLAALERKLRAEGGSTEANAGAIKPVAAQGVRDGGHEARLRALEAATDQQQQQLAAVCAQQEELRGLVVRLMGLLEAAGGATGRISQQPAEERFRRVEAAIYQVAKQVDTLDARARQEQRDTLGALQALLARGGRGGGA